MSSLTVDAITASRGRSVSTDPAPRWRKRERTASPPRHQLTEILFLHQHGADDDQPFHQELDVRIDVLQLKDVGEQAEDQDPDERAGEPAAPAHQARPADDDGGDRVELEAGAGVRLALAVLCDEQDARQSREQAGNDIGGELDLLTLMPESFAASTLPPIA